jgi:hypothetical protein
LRTDRNAHTQLSDAKGTASERAGFVFIWVPLRTMLWTFGLVFWLLLFWVFLGSFQPPKLGLEGLDKLDLFRCLTGDWNPRRTSTEVLSLFGYWRKDITYDLDYGAHGSKDLPGFALLLTLPQYNSSSYDVIPSWCWSMLIARAFYSLGFKVKSWSRTVSAHISRTAMISIENKRHSPKVRKQPTGTKPKFGM